MSTSSFGKGAYFRSAIIACPESIVQFKKSIRALLLAASFGSLGITIYVKPQIGYAPFALEFTIGVRMSFFSASIWLFAAAAVDSGEALTNSPAAFFTSA